MPPTTSTIATTRLALVEAFDTGQLTGNVFYAWPGADADRPEFLYVKEVRDWTFEDPVIKAGRRHRDEEYTFVFRLFVGYPEGSADSARTSFERAVSLLAIIESVLADDPKVGTNIQTAQMSDVEPQEGPLEGSPGWGHIFDFSVVCNARLT